MNTTQLINNAIFINNLIDNHLVKLPRYNLQCINANIVKALLNEDKAKIIDLTSACKYEINENSFINERINNIGNIRINNLTIEAQYNFKKNLIEKCRNNNYSPINICDGILFLSHKNKFSNVISTFRNLWGKKIKSKVDLTYFFHFNNMDQDKISDIKNSRKTTYHQLVHPEKYIQINIIINDKKKTAIKIDYNTSILDTQNIKLVKKSAVRHPPKNIFMINKKQIKEVLDTDTIPDNIFHINKIFDAFE
ncbi:hypothetical protein [Photobacterium leiognathi]|uniref:hypothetical protein n=1 Tax=Photobacterium leiognathi TaxID=553611 RepID=UPI00298280ED|nr:hypothetical protein [Photobacterium leiognathi]